MEKPLFLLQFLQIRAGISLLRTGVWAVQKGGFIHRAFPACFSAAFYPLKSRLYPRDKVDESGVHLLLEHLYGVLQGSIAAQLFFYLPFTVKHGGMIPPS